MKKLFIIFSLIALSTIANESCQISETTKKENEDKLRNNIQKMMNISLKDLPKKTCVEMRNVLLKMGIEENLFADKLSRFEKAIEKNCNSDDIANVLIDAYKQNFTDEEIEEMVKFNESPLGKKITEKSPEIMNYCQSTVNEKNQKVLEDLMKELLN